MRSSLRSLWLDLMGSYWFIPALLTTFALVLAVTTVQLDRSWNSAWLSSYAWFDAGGPEGARAQLTVIASAMVAVASTVFAITIAAVAYASGNYGPRLLTNFMNDRGNQLSLGVFIATFVYNLAVLRVVRNPGSTSTPGDPRVQAVTAEFVPQLSMVVSAASAIVAVAVLVYFLHHIPASIRINTVIGGIGRKLIRDIDRRFPDEGGPETTVPPPRGQIVTAQEVGYITIIDFAELDEIARTHRAQLALCVRTGDFIHPHLSVLAISGVPLDEQLQERLLQCFALGESRTPTQDLEFLIDELVEIALRALSPGVNDPFTAVTSMHWMGAALAKLADRDLASGPEQYSYSRERIRPVADDFEHFVSRSFGTLRASAATNVLAAKVFVEVLTGVCRGTGSGRRKAVLVEEARKLGRLADEALGGPSLEEVRARVDNLAGQSRGKAPA